MHYIRDSMTDDLVQDNIVRNFGNPKLSQMVYTSAYIKTWYESYIFKRNLLKSIVDWCNQILFRYVIDLWYKL